MLAKESSRSFWRSRASSRSLNSVMSSWKPTQWVTEPSASQIGAMLTRFQNSVPSFR